MSIYASKTSLTDKSSLRKIHLWYYEDLEEKGDLINEWINNEAVYRTAPATQGLLKKTMHYVIQLQ